MALPIAVLISGKGSNLAAILAAIDAGRCDASVNAVISDRPAAGLDLARSRGIATAIVALKNYPNRAAWDVALADAVGASAPVFDGGAPALRGGTPSLIVLAGFMRLVGPAFVERFAPRIINVHPSLLPAFPGKDGPEQAVRAGVRVSGCTVHVVDHGVDTGPIIAQSVVPLLPTDDAEQLHHRIQQAEHRLLPQVIDAIARGSIELGATLRVAPTCFEPEAVLSSPNLSGISNSGAAPALRSGGAASK